MLFEQRFWAGIADGSVTMTFRRWRRRQVVAGRRYRTAGGIVAVESVDVVAEDDVTDAEAHRAGYPSAATLVADLRGTPELPLYRVRFRVLDGDPREELAAADDLSSADVAELDRRLARLDRASGTGPWTAAALAVVAEHPGVRAADLASSLGRDRDAFKLDVRKLKALGLTRSLQTGYELSPRGRAYVVRRGA